MMHDPSSELARESKFIALAPMHPGTMKMHELSSTLASAAKLNALESVQPKMGSMQLPS